MTTSNNTPEPLTCQICDNASDETPHIFTCLHSFCQNCYGNLTEENHDGNTGIFCPVCNKFSNSHDIESNQILRDVLEGNNFACFSPLQNIAISDQMCRLCHKINVSSYCVNCKAELCYECHTNHNSFPQYTNHQVISNNGQYIFPVTGLNGENGKVTNKTSENYLSTPLQPEIDRASQEIQDKLDDIEKNRDTVLQLKNNVEESIALSKITSEDALVKAEADAEGKIAKIRQDLQTIKQEIHKHTQNTLNEGLQIVQTLQNMETNMAKVLSIGKSYGNANIQPVRSVETHKNIKDKLEALSDEVLNFKDANKFIDKQNSNPVFKTYHLPNCNIVGSFRTNYNLPISITNKPLHLEENQPINELPIVAAKKPLQCKAGIPRRPYKIQAAMLSAMPRRLYATPPKSVVQSQLAPPLEADIEALEIQSPPAQGSSSDGGSLLSEEAFRVCSGSLTSISTLVPELIKNLKLKNFYTRLSYFDEHIYCACFNKNCVDVYTLDGEWVRSISCGSIKCPRVLQPLDETKMLVAGYSGLFTIDTNSGKVLTKLLEGMFRDVHFDGVSIAALEKGPENKKDNVHIIQGNPPHEVSSRFSLYLDTAWSVLIKTDSVYISSGSYLSATSAITKYSLTGEKLEEFGCYGRTLPGELCTPYLCMSDIMGGLLVADHLNNRVQLLVDGKWVVMDGIQAKYPSDILIIGDFMFVNDLNNIHLYSLQLV